MKNLSNQGSFVALFILLLKQNQFAKRGQVTPGSIQTQCEGLSCYSVEGDFA